MAVKPNEKVSARPQPAVRKTAPAIEALRVPMRSAIWPSRSEPIDHPRLSASTAVPTSMALFPKGDPAGFGDWGLDLQRGE
jgi:hypothetical protein